MKRKWKKTVCGILTGFMIVTAAPTVFPGMGCVTETEVQAAATVATPVLSAIKTSGKNKIILNWKQVNGADGYQICRKTGSGSWKKVKTISGSKNVTFTDTSVNTGERYTYTVKAFQKSGGKTIWSSYNKKGLTAIAGLNSLTLNKSSLTLAPGKTYTLKLKGTKLQPSWKSSKTSVAKVASNGKITAVKTGTATITATLGGKKFTCKLTVKSSPATSTIAQNYEKLKKYIAKKGRYTEDGSQFINVKIDEERTFIIGYLKSSDEIDIGLLLTMSDEGIQAGVDIIGNCVKSDTVKVVSALAADGGISELVNATMKASAYKGQRLTFHYQNGKKATAELQNSSNTTLKAAMETADSYLKKNLNLTMEDLGFTAYK